MGEDRVDEDEGCPHSIRIAAPIFSPGRPPYLRRHLGRRPVGGVHFGDFVPPSIQSGAFDAALGHRVPYWRPHATLVARGSQGANTSIFKLAELFSSSLSLMAPPTSARATVVMLA
jgi:hypothetical protein